MKLRYFVKLVILLSVIGLGAMLVAQFAPTPGDKKLTMPTEITPELIKRGEYLARVGDCVACHTKPQGQLFAGGLAIQSPVGGMVPKNITPDLETGIGKYSYGDFVRAVRYGVNPDNETLYPAMPWPSYAKIADSDMQALYAYFMKGVKPVSQKADSNTIPWPLSMRWPVTYWRWLFGPEVSPKNSPPTEAAALGQYFVEGLGHCGACHTPRGIGLQEKAVDAAAGPDYLSGGSVIDGYAVPSLRGNLATGLGRINIPTIVEILKTGRSQYHATFGGMSQVVTDSTQYMVEGDLLAVALFLKTLPANRREEPTRYDMATYKKLSDSSSSLEPGAKLYKENCSGCHLTNGLGYSHSIPALAVNPATVNPNPSGLIQIVLAGQKNADTNQAQKPTIVMPSFQKKLSDQEIAELLTFVRNAWGNKASSVTASEVASVRKSFLKNNHD